MMVISDYYYLALKTEAERTKFRAAVLSRTGMGASTFYYKLAQNKFKPAEYEVISSIIKDWEK